MVTDWSLVHPELGYCALIQIVSYFFPNATSLGGPFLCCVGVYIDNFSTQKTKALEKSI